MSLSIGIVGLPNVGKSTLFNALSSKQAEAANYAFCTIDPNVGVVPVPDPRFDELVKLFNPQKKTPATVDFVDIAGLVRGASKGEGRGNAFLSNIREVDAIAHVVRCFEDENILHVDNRVDPLADIETIETELILKDLETVSKQIEKAQRAAKGNNALEKKRVELCEELRAILDQGKPLVDFECEDEDKAKMLRELFLITKKPMFFVGNVKENQLANLEQDPLVDKLRQFAASRNQKMAVISAAIEAEVASLAIDERKEYLEALGLEEAGLNQVVRTGYAILDLITYFTCGEKEVRAWTIKRNTKAPQAAGKIHSDFEKGFIKAETISYTDMITYKSESEAKSAGKMRIEGKEYIVQDGDIMHFRFNV